MSEDIRFVAATGGDNWLDFFLADNSRHSLPYGLKVQWLEVKDKREQFKILEGVYKGKLGSVKEKGAGASWFTKAIRHKQKAVLRFDREKQSLSYGSSGPISAFSGAFTATGVRYTQVAPGIYPLQIPAYPSKQTRPQYTKWARMHKTWFRIGLDPTGSRFVHVGEISEGCVTVRAFQFDPSAKATEPGFEDLPNLKSQYPGAIGFPYPLHPSRGGEVG